MHGLYIYSVINHLPSVITMESRIEESKDVFENFDSLAAISFRILMTAET